MLATKAMTDLEERGTGRTQLILSKDRGTTWVSEPIQSSSSLSGMSLTWRFTCRYPGSLLLSWLVAIYPGTPTRAKELLQLPGSQFSVSLQ